MSTGWAATSADWGYNQCDGTKDTDQSVTKLERDMVTAQFNPLAPGALANPYPMYKALQEEAPWYWSEMFEAWVLTRYDDVDAVLNHPRFSADRSQARGRMAEMMRQRQSEAEDFGIFSRVQTMLTSDPPEHTRLRKLVSKAFTPKAVENLRPRIQEIVDELLDQRRRTRSEFDLVEELAYPMPVIVIAEMLGVPAKDRARFKHWSDNVVATLGGPFTAPEVMSAAQQSLVELVEYLQDFIKERRASPREDLISGLVAAEERGDVLSEEEILATTILLLIAGNETTTNLISNSVYTLLNNRDQWDILRNEPDVMPSAIEELLRFCGPVQLTGRVAMEDLEINGHKVEEGTPCTTLLGAANRDPAKFPDPDRFDVRRNPKDHVGLGDGIHFCLGAPLARAEAAIAIGELIKRFPDLQFRGDGAGVGRELHHPRDQEPAGGC